LDWAGTPALAKVAPTSGHNLKQPSSQQRISPAPKNATHKKAPQKEGLSLQPKTQNQAI
jgi:hypothetical protein